MSTLFSAMSPTAGESASGESPAFIVMDGVRKTYGGRSSAGVEALAGVSLQVRRGEFVSLLGPSGCGKSTLLNLVAGLAPLSDGEIAIGGTRVTRPLTDVGIVFQSPVLLEWRTALQNVMLQVEARKLDRQRYEARAEELLEAVGLSGFRQCYPWELSGGMQQRVSICRALVHDPPLLLMDEPFGSLDALTREQMMVEVQRLWRRSAKTILFVTHSIQEAVFLSDRVVVMSPRPGRIERILSIDLPRPRRVRSMTEPAFAHYVDEVTEIFQARGVISEDD